MLTCRTIERFDTELQIVANCELDQLHRLIGAQISSRSFALARSDGSGDAGFARTSTLTKSSVATSIPPSELRGWREEAHDLASRASRKTIQALHDLATRLGYNTHSPNRDPFI